MRCTVVILLLGICTPLAAAEWGDLTMRFVYDGEPPKPRLVTVDKDGKFCGRKEIPVESLVVNATNRGLANVIVWLESRVASAHPSYADANKEVVLSIDGCRFSPHIVVARTTQTLVIVNKDPVGHNPNYFLLNNQPVGTSIMATARTVREPFEKAEFLPVHAQCNIHPWMSAWLLVRDNPYTAISDEHGKLAIANLPVGKHTLRIWHEQPKLVKAATQGGKAVEWPRGRLEVEIKPGENDLGQFALSPDLFSEAQQ